MQGVLRNLNILSVVLSLSFKLVKTFFFDAIDCARMVFTFLLNVLFNSQKNLLCFICLLNEGLLGVSVSLFSDLHALLQLNVAFTGTL